MNRAKIISGLVLLTLIGVSSCAPLPASTATEVQAATSTEEISFTPTSEETSTSAPESTLTKVIPVTGHLMTPPDTVPEAEKRVNDVESSAASAPYGDSYRINRFERPFEQDMTYVPELDIISFELSEDDDWYYVSITLNGNDPNSSLEINYGVEIDLNADGFGDYIVWARPPYTIGWETDTIQAYEDGDRDTAGLSSRQSDAVFDGNGYETLLFEGGSDQNADPDLAWVRMLEGERATIQLALKKSWLGGSFLVGVISDAGLRDLSKFDYSDKFAEADAGSPVKNNPYYPVGSVYAVDNTCWEAHGFENLAYQPKFCPVEVLPTATRRPSSNLQTINTATAIISTIPVATNINPPTNEPLTSQPPTNQPPTNQPPTNQPPTNQPPTNQPPTNQPPTSQPLPPPTKCTPNCGGGPFDPDTCQCA